MKAAALLALALLAGQALAQEPPSTIAVAGGMGVAVSDETDVYPAAEVEGDFPLYLGSNSAARIRARLELSGLPGDATDESGLNLLDLQTFKAAGAGLTLAARVGVSPPAEDGSRQHVYLEVVGETWTRLVTRDARPRERFAAAVTAGVRIERRSLSGQVDRYVSARWGRSDVAAPEFGLGQVVLEGRARVANYKGTDLNVGARVDADVKRSTQGKDRFNVFAQVGRP